MSLFHPPEVILAAAEEAARAGAQALMPYWRRLDPSEITEKATNDLVTTADRAAEAAILSLLRQRFPSHRVLSEEAGSSGGEGAPLWIVDPLDGTTNFVHGVPHFAVSIALAVEEKVELGVILDPVKRDLRLAPLTAGTS